MSTAIYVALGILGVFVVINIYNYRKIKNMPAAIDSENIIHLDNQNFERLTKNGMVLVDFWASWCMPCRMMAPILNEVSNEINGRAKICKVDVQKHPEFSSKFNIRGIPTLVLLKNGKEINRFVGVKTKEFLLKQLNQVNNES